MIRTTKRLLHVVGYLLAGGTVLVGLAVWRLASGPVTLSMLSPLVSQSLEAAALAAGNLRVKVGDTVVVWDTYDNPLELRLRDVEVIAEDGRSVVTVPDLAVGFSLGALILDGRLALARLTVIRPTLHLERTFDGRLALDLDSPGATRDKDKDRGIQGPAVTESGSALTAVLEALRHPVPAESSLGALRQVSIAGATVTLEDQASGVVWSMPRADLTLSRHRDGGRLEGRVELSLADRTAVIEVSGDANQGDDRGPAGAHAVVRFRDFDAGALAAMIPVLAPLARVRVPLSGEVVAVFDRDWQPANLRLTLKGEGPGEAVGTNRPQVGKVAVAATLDVAARALVLERVELILAEPALRLTAEGRIDGGLTAPKGRLGVTVARGGRTARLEGTLDPAVAGSLDSAGSVATVRLDGLEPALFAPLDPMLGPLAAAAFPITGTVIAALDGDRQPLQISLDLTGGPGRLIAPPELLPEPVPVRGVALKASVDRPLDAIPARLDLAELMVEFAEPINGTAATLKVDGRVVRVGERLTIVGGVRARRVPIEALPRLWPSKVGKGARPWLIRNIVAGVVDDAWIRVDGSAPIADPGEIRATTLEASVEASNLTVNYFKTLTPVIGISGHGTSDGRNLILTTKGGRIGDLLVGDGRVDISKLDTPQEWIDIDIPLSGPLRTALTVLDTPPLRYPHRVGINPATTEGTQTCRLRFVFPLRNDLDLDQVAIHADAALHGAAVQGIAGGIDASQGELKLALDESGLDLTGTARLNGLASNVQWRENFPDAAEIGTKVVVKALVTPADLVARGVDPGVMFTGTTDADIRVVIDRKKRIIANGVLDLASARLELPVIGLVKPLGQAGSARFVLDFDHGRPVRASGLTIESGGESRGLKATGYVDLTPSTGAPNRVVLNRFNFGATDTSADVRRRSDGIYDIVVKGASLDARSLFRSPEDTAEKLKLRQQRLARRGRPPTVGPRYDLSMALDRVVTGGGGRTLSDVRGTVRDDGIGWDTLNLSAKVPGGGAGEAGSGLSVLYQPDAQAAGGRRLDLTSDDAGAVLRALDFSDSIRGGRLTVTGSGTPGIPARPLTGTIELGGYRVIDASLLARLLNALSVSGLLQLLGGEGLTFSELNSDFVWGEDLIAIDNLRTSGAALGLTAAGNLDLADGTLAVQGTIVPVYGLNRIVGMIPVLGDLLSGGSGQGIFAATYDFKGPIEHPEVSVNPLAVLAPGFLRNLFFLK